MAGIDWVDEKCKLWGRAKWKLMTAKEKFPKSPSGKLMEEGPGAAGSGGVPDPLEGFLGDALHIALAIPRAFEKRKLTPRQFEILLAHYVIKGPPDEKGKYTTIPVKVREYRLGISHKRYYVLLAAAHRNLVPFLPEGGWTPSKTRTQRVGVTFGRV